MSSNFRIFNASYSIDNLWDRRRKERAIIIRELRHFYQELCEVQCDRVLNASSHQRNKNVDLLKLVWLYQFEKEWSRKNSILRRRWRSCEYKSTILSYWKRDSMSTRTLFFVEIHIELTTISCLARSIQMSRRKFMTESLIERFRSSIDDDELLESARISDEILRFDKINERRLLCETLAMRYLREMRVDAWDLFRKSRLLWSIWRIS